MNLIKTDKAPKAIGPYSQAIKAGDWIYISGQIPLCPNTMEVVGETVEKQAEQVFKNLSAIVEAAQGTIDKLVKVTIYLTDLSQFELVNQVMTQHFHSHQPARAVVGVKALPKDVMIEAEAIMYCI
jgi:reactive intermediate/imine deaminase